MTDNPRHRGTAASYLDVADGLISDIKLSDVEDVDKLLALAQTRALVAIGHALVDLAEDGIKVFHDAKAVTGDTFSQNSHYRRIRTRALRK